MADHLKSHDAMFLRMLDALTITVGVVGVVAVLLNFYALHIFISRPKQRLGSKFMIPIVVALNIFQSLIYTLSIPVSSSSSSRIFYKNIRILENNSS